MSVLSTLFSCFRQPSKAVEQEPQTTRVSSALFGICGEDYVSLPGDSRYTEWSKSYNLDEPVVAEPAAVVRPRTAQEVAGVVKFAAKNGYKVQAKSGGHSYANFCEFSSVPVHTQGLCICVSYSTRSWWTRKHQYHHCRSGRTNEVQRGQEDVVCHYRGGDIAR